MCINYSTELTFYRSLKNEKSVGSLYLDAVQRVSSCHWSQAVSPDDTEHKFKKLIASSVCFRALWAFQF